MKYQEFWTSSKIITGPTEFVRSTVVLISTRIDFEGNK